MTPVIFLLLSCSLNTAASRDATGEILQAPRCPGPWSGSSAARSTSPSWCLWGCNLLNLLNLLPRGDSTGATLPGSVERFIGGALDQPVVVSLGMQPIEPIEPIATR